MKSKLDYLPDFEYAPRVDSEHIQDLLQLDSGKVDLIMNLYNICHEQQKLRVSNMKTATAKVDLKQIERESHTFKTTCHNIGAKRAYSICHAINMEAKTINCCSESLLVLIELLDEELTAALQEIKLIIENTKILNS